MNRRRSSLRLAMAAVLLASSSLTAVAADLVIGRANEPSAIDPQFSRTGNNQMTADNMFEGLLLTDANLQMGPGLATEWKTIDELTWEISLREGVKFHDGSDFTADDAIYSLERTDEVPNSPAPFTDNVSSIASMEKIDDHTIRITTDVPTPQLMEQIGRVFIVSKETTEDASLEDFNSGEAAIGTGPYQFVEWRPGESLTVRRFEDYWAEKPDFEEVEFRFISNDAARTAALLSGDVDVIDGVSPADVPRLEEAEGIEVYSTESGRLIYLALSQRDNPPGIVGVDGEELEESPLQDARVRKAISLMIDRQLLVDRILNGSGVPTGQLVPSALGGYAEDIAPDTPDLERVQALLAEAGYPDGFGITLYSSNDRFPGDGDIAQAIGQMLARGGLTVNGVETQPYNVYSGNATDGEFGAFIFSLGSSTPNAEPNLRALLQTHDPEAGTGGFNRMRYSNAEFDEALNVAVQEFDEEKRNELLAEATRIAMEDQAIVPLYLQKVHWAAREGVEITPTVSERTTAIDAEIAE